MRPSSKVFCSCYSSSAFPNLSSRCTTSPRAATNCQAFSWSGESPLQVKSARLIPCCIGLTHLSSPGVHWLQDPRSRVYNFTPWLQTVPKVSEFDFDRIPRFVPSSRDTVSGCLGSNAGKLTLLLRLGSSDTCRAGKQAFCRFYVFTIGNSVPLLFPRLGTQGSGHVHPISRLPKYGISTFHNL